MFYVVSYDIPDDATRTKVFKLLEDFGKRVQFSVFECILDDKRLKEMTERIKKLIDVQKDSVRIYALCAACTKLVKILGLGELTEDKEVYII
jgi:CRISPR-associated protein Cas2